MKVVHAFSSSTLRRKFAVTFALLVLFRIGSMLPAPGVATATVSRCLAEGAAGASGAVGTLNLFSGGALLQLSLFSVGILPAITAAIVMQLLASIIGPLKRAKRNGGAGREKITQYTRYLTVALGAAQGVAVASYARGTPSRLMPSCTRPLVDSFDTSTLVLMTVAFTGGAVLVMWLAELITAHGFGNGTSLILFVSIVAAVPAQVRSLLAAHGAAMTALVAAALIGMIALVVLVELSTRKVAVHYTKAAGSAGPAASASYLPLKLMQAGISPVIFASTTLTLPPLLARASADSAIGSWILTHLSPGASASYLLAQAVLIVGFSVVYIVVSFNPTEVADDLARAHGFVPGHRPGRATAVYLDGISSRLLLPGALLLTVIALAPTVALALTGSLAQIPLSGTALLIAVGVALETSRQVDSQLVVDRPRGVLQ